MVLDPCFKTTHILQGHFGFVHLFYWKKEGRKGESFALFDAQEAIHLHRAQRHIGALNSFTLMDVSPGAPAFVAATYTQHMPYASCTGQTQCV
jgi:hypothetical protein